MQTLLLILALIGALAVAGYAVLFAIMACPLRNDEIEAAYTGKTTWTKGNDDENP